MGMDVVKSKRMKILVGQMTSMNSVESNFRQIEEIISRSKESPSTAFFPENCLYMRIKEGESIPELTLQHPVFRDLGRLASEKQMNLHLGSVPIADSGKLTNATVLITKDGAVSVQYRKIHLFDIQLDGGKAIRESDVFNAGKQPAILEIDGRSFGQSICYDLRFSELYSFYAKRGVEVLLVPAAFLVPTGRAHWEVLLRARAIESQAFVIAAAQAGLHRSSQGDQRETYGHSLVIDPWGTIIAGGTADQVEAIAAELDFEKLESVRKQIPMAGHRRLN